jgi:hypothetical protein
MRVSCILHRYMMKMGVIYGNDSHPVTTKSQNPLHLVLSLSGIVYKNFLQVSMAEIWPVHKTCDLSLLLTMWPCLPTDGLKLPALQTWYFLHSPTVCKIPFVTLIIKFIFTNFLENLSRDIGFLFSTLSRPALWPIQWVLGLKLITHLHLVLKWRIWGSLHPLSHSLIT